MLFFAIGLAFCFWGIVLGSMPMFLLGFVVVGTISLVAMLNDALTEYVEDRKLNS